MFGFMGCSNPDTESGDTVNVSTLTQSSGSLGCSSVTEKGVWTIVLDPSDCSFGQSGKYEISGYGYVKLSDAGNTTVYFPVSKTLVDVTVSDGKYSFDTGLVSLKTTDDKPAGKEIRFVCKSISLRYIS